MRLIKVHRNPATNFRGARWYSDDGCGNRSSVAEDSGLNAEENALSSAITLASKFQWKNLEYVGSWKYQYFFKFESR